MTHERDQFSPRTIDEQIEQLSQMPRQIGQPESTRLRLVRRLRRLYTANEAEEQRARSLEHAWERITETSAYARQVSRLPDEQPGMQERKLHMMKIQQDSSPLQRDELVPRPTQRLPRFGRLAQVIAAVLIVSLLLGGFAALVATRHTPGGSQTGQTPGTAASSSVPAPQSIVVTADQDGTVYGIRPSDGTVLWRYHTGQQLIFNDGIIPRSHYLLLQDNVVYFAANTQVYALRAADGNLLWQQSLAIPGHAQTIYDQLAYDNGRLYIGGEVYPLTDEAHDAVVVGLQANDGKMLWQQFLGNGSFEPLLAAANGQVYAWEEPATGSRPTLRALSGGDGQLLWNYALPAEPISMQTTSDAAYLYLAEDLATDSNGFHKENKSLLALRAQGGTFLWSKSVIDTQAGPLVMEDGLLILGLNGTTNRFCAYQPAGGAQVWCVNDGSAGEITNAIAMNGDLYSVTVPDPSTMMVGARRASDGGLLWSNSFTVALQGSTNLAALDGTLYVATFNGVLALTASNGHTLWNFSSDGGQIIGPVDAGSW